MIRIRDPQDFGAAVVFALIGAAGIYLGKDLEYGTASNMGPGYFPIILSALILVLGLGLGLKSMMVHGPRIEAIRFRPLLFIIGVVLLFGFALEAVGLALAAVILTVASAYARRDVNLSETLLLGAGLALFSVVVFVFALSQPLSAWWGK